MCALVCSLSASLFYRQTTLVMIQILCDQISDIMPSLSKVCQTMLHKAKKIFICIYNNSIQKINTDTQWPPISSSSSNVCIPRHCAKCLQSVSFYFLAHDLNQCHMQYPGFMHFKNLINYFFFTFEPQSLLPLLFTSRTIHPFSVFSRKGQISYELMSAKHGIPNCHKTQHCPCIYAEQDNSTWGIGF